MSSTRLWLLSLAFGLSVAAQKSPTRGMDNETFLDMESISSPAISPDGRTVAFARSSVDKLKDQHRANLWLVNSDGSRIRELTSGTFRDSEPVWAPDGRRLAFLSDRDGTTQIHVMWMDTHEILRLTRVDRTPGSLVWSPDGKQIAFTMLVPDDEPILHIQLPKAPPGAQWARRETVVDHLTWGRDGLGPLPRGYQHVFVIDASTGGTARQLTSGKYNHNSPEWSADGKTIFVSAIRKPDAEYTFGDTEIYALNVSTGEARPLTDRKGPDANPTPSPDGAWIAYTGYDDHRITFTVPSIYLMKADGSAKELWAGGLPSGPGRMVWSPDSRGIYYTMEEHGVADVYFLPLETAPTKIAGGDYMLAAMSIAKTGDAVAIKSNINRPPVLVGFSLKNPAAMTSLVDLNTDLLYGRSISPGEELAWTSADGWKVQGWLVKPVNFESGKKYPMVLYIHGGPWSMYSVGWNWAWQNFASHGYAVLFLNPRGSTGYGQEFVSGIQYSYPGKDYDDLMSGVDAAIKKGFIDESNLFVCGGSGGGVLTAWIVGHTNRFRAAVSMRPVIDWHSFVGNTDGDDWYRQFKKYPWEDPAEYAARSPLSYVANVTTPTMVMTGEADLRTPITQSEEFYRALKLLHKETLLVRMPEEFHGWRRPSHQLLQQLYLLAWFDKYRTKGATTLSAQR